MMLNDTICAVATAMGQGGINIIRLSGPDCLAIARKIFRAPKDEFPPREMVLGKVMDGQEMIDQALLVYFAAPASFTGEHVAEIHCHGGSVVTRRILSLLLENGARLAQPGEFSRRAFLNGKMELSQAEAVCDLIGAMSEKSAKVSARQLEGSLGREVGHLQDVLSDAMAALEAGIEYPEEDLEEAIAFAQLPGLEKCLFGIETLIRSYRQGRLLRDGICVAIVGRPNVG
ncbi:MAG: tRNA uridine-5-carboxymethylaminomethyl(34) synthesis GTPase MnmE, partial [Christensenellaceae bacterium]|nr:tRNA uridine-5-carboxymethylaminomethyl(34) synthesis GTPase MnmE [Christensenellaceae bacterium]